MKTTKNEEGFTIIEVLIAMLVLMVGVLGTVIMQDAFIGGNHTAIKVTGSANAASDRMEILMALDYDDLTDEDNVGDAGYGAAGLNDTDGGSVADGSVVQGDQTLFWNVANDFPIFGAKTIRVIVRRTDGGLTNEMSIDFMKMRPI